jgi:hypothetical protein
MGAVWEELYNKWVDLTTAPIWEALPSWLEAPEYAQDSNQSGKLCCRVWYENRYWPLVKNMTYKEYELVVRSGTIALVTKDSMEPHEETDMLRALQDTEELLLEHDLCYRYLAGIMRFPLNRELGIEAMGAELTERFDDKLKFLYTENVNAVHEATTENLRAYIKAQRGDCIDKLEARILLNLLI